MVDEGRDLLAAGAALEIDAALLLAEGAGAAGDALVFVDLDFLACGDGGDGQEIAVVIRHEVAGDLDGLGGGVGRARHVQSLYGSMKRTEVRTLRGL